MGGLEWSEGFFRVLGLDPKAVRPSASAVTPLVHPNDIDKLGPVDDIFAGSQVDSAVSFRVVRPDGQLKHVAMTAISMGTAPGMVHGVLQDVTAFASIKARRDSYHLWLQAIMRLQAIDLLMVDGWGNLVDRLLRSDSPLRAEPTDDIRSRLETIHPEDRARFLEARLNQSPGPRFETYRQRLNGDDQYRTVHMEAVSMRPDGTASDVLVGYARVTNDTGTGARLATDLRSRLLRAARAYADWSIAELSKRSSVSSSTIRRIEAADNYEAREDNIRALWGALESAGIRLHIDGDKGPSLQIIEVPQQ